MRSVLRTVKDNLLRSENLPNTRIRVDPQFAYVGNTSFILYDVAHVEQHHFVTADDKNRVERLLWFQFEGYLENNEHRYQYSGMDSLTLGSLTFLHDADVLNIDDDYVERPSSDSSYVVDYLKSEGYTLEGNSMFKRLVWLNAGLRNELMIIYSEDLRPTGFRISELTQGGMHIEKWTSMAEALHERALSSFSVEPY